MYCWSQVVTEKRSGIDDCMSGEMGRHLFQLFTLTSVVWFVLRKYTYQGYSWRISDLFLAHEVGFSDYRERLSESNSFKFFFCLCHQKQFRYPT